MEESKLKTLLKKYEISYSEFGKVLGVSKQRVHQMVETGRISHNLLPKICYYLRCTPNDLIDWKVNAEIPHSEGGENNGK